MLIDSIIVQLFSNFSIEFVSYFLLLQNDDHSSRGKSIESQNKEWKIFKFLDTLEIFDALYVRHNGNFC